MSEDLELASTCARLRHELDNLEDGKVGFLEFGARVDDILLRHLTGILCKSDKGQNDGQPVLQ